MKEFTAPLTKDNYLKLMNLLHSGVLDIRYRKVNATTVTGRTATLNIDIINEIEHAHYTQKQLDNKTTSNEFDVPPYITYYDIDAGGFRRFRTKNFVDAWDYREDGIYTYDVEYECWELAKYTRTIDANSEADAEMKFNEFAQADKNYERTDYEIISIEKR